MRWFGLPPVMLEAAVRGRLVPIGVSIFRQRFSRRFGQFTVLPGKSTSLLEHFDDPEMFPADIVIVEDVGRKDVPAPRRGGATIEITGLGAGRHAVGSTGDRKPDSEPGDQAGGRDKGESQTAEAHHRIKVSPTAAPATIAIIPVPSLFSVAPSTRRLSGATQDDVGQRLGARPRPNRSDAAPVSRRRFDFSPRSANSALSLSPRIRSWPRTVRDSRWPGFARP